MNHAICLQLPPPLKRFDRTGGIVQSSAAVRPVKEKNIQEILGLLRSYNPANKSEVGRLAELVYPHLRRIAAGLLTRENRIGASIQATMLADDSIIRLIVKKKVESKDWPHFLSIAAKTMREMLIDHIRVKRAKRRYFGV